MITERNKSKGHIGIGMNGLIARWYAKNTAKSMEEYRKGARHVAEYLHDGDRVLEIAPGPGYMAIELARLGSFEITAVDISETFVDIATRNAREAGVSVDFRVGDASDLPLESDRYDLACCRAAFKNFARPVQAIAEMHRVLRHGGVALIDDLRPDITDETIDSLVDQMGLGLLDAIATRWTFKYSLAKRAHPKEELRQMAAATPFKSCEVHENPVGYEVVLRK